MVAHAERFALSLQPSSSRNVHSVGADGGVLRHCYDGGRQKRRRLTSKPKPAGTPFHSAGGGSDSYPPRVFALEGG